MTTNKGLNKPIAGSTGWNVPLNDNADIIDRALGDYATVTGTTGSVSLSTTQVQSLCLKSGTSAFTADVTYVIPATVAGQWIVQNQSASSSYSLIVKNDASGTSVSIANGQTRIVYSDGAKVFFSDSFPSIATQAQAEAATDNTTTMTPLRTSQQVQYSRATQAQAEAATDNTTLMTPLRTSQAITALAPSPTTATVLAATAGASLGAVGTYAFLFNLNAIPGGTAAGSTTWYSNAGSDQYGTTRPTGTWRAMGFPNTAAAYATLCLRIS